jgi:diguanylate cyclase (GGDEF)-like protein/PAS domain S-box-containing protein
MIIVRDLLTAVHLTRAKLQGDNGHLARGLADAGERDRRAPGQLRLADIVFGAVQEGIVVTDLRGMIISVNPAMTDVTEYKTSELIGQSVRIFNSRTHDRKFFRQMWSSIRSTGSWEGEIWDRRKSGEIFQQWLRIRTVRDDAGRPCNYVGLFTDISRMQHARTQLERLAHYDELTGLPNRALLRERMSHSIEQVRRTGALCAALLIDLDDFKNVNDSLGHEAGDELLRLAAGRMTERLRRSDTLSRWGGDEFALILENIPSPDYAARVAQEVITRLLVPFRLAQGAEVRIGASIGISLFPAHGDGPESLLRAADGALYLAKQGGRGTWRLPAGY